MAKCLFQFSVVLLIIGQATVTRAQVFDAPAAQPNVGVQRAGGPSAAAPTGTVKQTGWSSISMPKLTLPKLTMPSMSSVTVPVRSGISKVSVGTKKAWEGTKEIFTFGQDKKSSAANRRTPAAQKKPSFWKRMLVRDSKPQVPQTVGEFMSQPRLDP